MGENTLRDSLRDLGSLVRDLLNKYGKPSRYKVNTACQELERCIKILEDAQMALFSAKTFQDTYEASKKINYALSCYNQVVDLLDQALREVNTVRNEIRSIASSASDMLSTQSF